MRDAAAIADSGPLICLARINQLELLPRLFSKILVPPEVWNEVTVRGQGHPGAYEVSQATWLTIQAPDPQLVKPVETGVDGRSSVQGEECIQQKDRERFSLLSACVKCSHI
jgi:uncharacterized protein